MTPAGASQAVTWSVREGAPCGSVSATGLYSSPASIPSPSNQCHVVATSVADNTQSGSGLLGVVASPLTSVTINPTTPSLQVGATVSFSLSPVPASQAFEHGTWVVVEGASCGTVDPSSGAYVAPAVVPSGACHVTGTSALNTTLSATATVTVTTTQITSVTVTPATPTVEIGGIQVLTAAILPSGANGAVTWSIQEGAVCGTVTGGGLYYAPLTFPGGPCHVVATSVASAAASGTATVEVVATTANSIEVLPTDPTVRLGATQQFTSVVGPAGAGQAVTWSIPEGASCGTISATGEYTAPQSTPTGACHVTATSAVNAAESASATVSTCSGGSGCSYPHFTDVWGGARHCLAHRSDGSVWGWGFNWFGNLGDGSITDQHAPVEMLGPGGYGHVSAPAIMGGESHNFVLLDDGHVWSLGWDVFGQLGDGTNNTSTVLVETSGVSGITSLGGRGYHSLAIAAGGAVWAWGDGRDGQLGNGTNPVSGSNVPVQVTGLSSVLAVTGGGFHSVALMPDHSLQAWGRGGQGELGHGDFNNQNVPVAVTGISNVTQVSAGWEHTVALTSDGTVWTWGGNSSGELGDGTTTDSDVPHHVAALTNIVYVSAGDCHTAALAANGTVWAWGCNGMGELGNGSNLDSSIPTMVIGLTDVIAIAARDYHNVAIRADDTLWTWGFNADGQLGDGTTTDRNVPVQVLGLP